MTRPADTTTSSDTQDLSSMLEALSTGKATFYNHVKQGEDAGRLILTKHRLAWYPEEDHHQQTESADVVAIKVSFDKVIKYRVSSVFDDHPTITIVNRKQQSLPFVLSSKADMERLKLDLKQRLGGKKKKKNTHNDQQEQSSSHNPQQQQPPSQQQQPSRINIPIQHEIPRDGEPDTLIIVYKTKNEGSEISYTSLKADGTTSNDAADSSTSILSSSISGGGEPPKLTSTNMSPQETVTFVQTMISARNETMVSISEYQEQQQQQQQQQQEDNKNQTTIMPKPSAIVIATVYKNAKTKLGLVLGHKENQQLCIVSMTPNSLLRSTPLSEGMEVISINNTDCRTLDSPAAARLVKSAEGTLTIVARQPLPSVNNQIKQTGGD